MNHYSGIDLHWDNCYITTLDENGVIVKQQRVENIREFLIAYFHSLPGTHIAVVESTTDRYWLNDLLLELLGCPPFPEHRMELAISNEAVPSL